ncbi:carbohydrate esterase family 4 protein [Hymenopellis radicata]|nr:carbohydrate esterase family 4 protein [Hymenopellis radicata]
MLFSPRGRAQKAIRHCTKPNTVAITFDDIVNTLNEAGAKATFFFIGCIYDGDNMERIRYAYNNGHQVASHTWAHEDLTTLTWDQLHDEMWRVEQALQRIVGASPAFMRPPYGNYNKLVREAAEARGQKVIIWDFDSEDSVGATAAQSKKLYRDAIAEHPDTILALNHEVYETTAHDVLPYAIKRLQAAGYELVTLAECLGEEPYQWTAAPGTPDASWTC